MNIRSPEFWLLMAFAGLMVIVAPAHATDAYTDDRYLPEGVEIARNADGSIKRDAKVLREFQKIHPCPSTGSTTGACPGWKKDHVISLACRGVDAVRNMQWLDDITKAFKDAFERYIYAKDGFSSAGCKNKVIKLI
jgi:hypothetical protein